MTHEPHKTMTLALALAFAAGCPMDDDDDGPGGNESSSDGGDSSAGPTGSPSTTAMSTSSTTSDPGTSTDSSTGPGSSSSSSSDGSSSSGASLFSVSGYARRLPSAMIAAGNDGVGNLIVGALPACDAAEFGNLLGAAIVPDSDVSDVDNMAPFTIEGLAAGTVHLASFLDDNLDGDPVLPLPGPGDLVHAPNGVGNDIIDCVEVEIVDADVTGVDIPLDGTVPGL